jgi:hypothetical protein
MVRAGALEQRWRSRIALVLLVTVACDVAWGLPATIRQVAAARETPPFVVVCRSDTPIAATPNKTIKCWQTMRRSPGEPVGLMPDEVRAPPRAPDARRRHPWPRPASE